MVVSNVHMALVSAPPLLAPSSAASSSCWWRGCQHTTLEAIRARSRDVTSLRDFIAAAEVGNGPPSEQRVSVAVL